MPECFAPTGRGPMKTQGFERRLSQNLAAVSREKTQNPYLAYISHLFSQPYLLKDNPELIPLWRLFR
ncbi:MAG: hypothetical protein EWV77_18050 [Microcystis viridis Mv_BB_P_19951000_S68D]|uniref:Uncharacterized protein n=1 Tax=Microcystis viridis Mv_BB_P_19951000_S68D TaxID=2486270 RepID=A0A552HF64_MICVR|nr:MAG: hypothetical protein EWV77_18050 [Microcystis viridis Mv_BB_P_19951000_S68D]